MRKVLFLGDSLTAGGYYKYIKVDGEVPAGEGWIGNQVADIMSQAAAKIAKESPTDVVLLAGVNNVWGGQAASKTKKELLAAWAQIRTAGARVWAVKLTPWFGYNPTRKDKKTGVVTHPVVTAAMRRNTLELNEWIQGMVGQQGGPDYYIDTALLGDAAYNLKPKYSHDKLHMKPAGQKLLARLVAEGLQQAAGATAMADSGGDTAVVGAVSPTQQATPWTCGSACLRAVMKHYGCDADEETVATIVGSVPVFGVQAPGLVAGARKLGYRAEAVALKDVDALKPFIAAGVPVIVTVNSFTKPGKQFHWCVVVSVGPGEGGIEQVVLMDPNAPELGNRRVLSAADFDARWWHYRWDEHDQRVLERRPVVIVAPVVEDWTVGSATGMAELGKDEPKPTHGRVAHCGTGGGLFGKIVKSIIHYTHKALFTAFATAFTGGYGAKEMTALSDRIMRGPSGKKDKILPDGQTMNGLPNMEVAIIGVDVMREKLLMVEKERAAGKLSKMAKWWDGAFAAAGVTKDVLDGDSADLVLAAFRLFFVLSRGSISFPACSAAHICEGIAILAYGPGAAEVVHLIRDKRPKGADGKWISWEAWLGLTVKALDASGLQAPVPSAEVNPTAVEPPAAVGRGRDVNWDDSDDDIEGHRRPKEPGSPQPDEGHTFDHDKADDAARRLGNFLKNAKIPGKALVLNEKGGLCLGVRDEGMEAPHDFEAIPKSVRDLIVKVVG